LFDGGWVSIHSPENSGGCVFQSLSGQGGDFLSYPLGAGNYAPLDRDLSMCLTGPHDPVYRACCEESIGTCSDHVEFHDCLAQGGRFQANMLCADMTPPCGQQPGACCFSDGQCQETTAQSCPTLVGDTNCDGAITFADIDVFVEALAGESAWNHPGCPWLNADCNHDGRVTFADIDPFVDILSNQSHAYGSFSGFGTTCTPNPCAAPGENCENPFVVTGPLPYDDVGDTTGFADNYAVCCPFFTGTGRDVVYRYTPLADVHVDASLCFDETGFSTVLYVFEQCPPGYLVGCNQDYCTTPSVPVPVGFQD
jgi:hypothetical protein